MVRHLVAVAVCLLTASNTVAASPNAGLRLPIPTVIIDDQHPYAAVLDDPEYQRIKGAGDEEADGSEHWRKRAIANGLLTEFVRREESQYYPGGHADRAYPAGLPQMCVAFSGGGMRSAVFNMGVLHGMHDAGALASIDIISAVSGGSWAAYWYQKQRQSGLSTEALYANFPNNRILLLRQRAESWVPAVVAKSTAGNLLGITDSNAPDWSILNLFIAAREPIATAASIVGLGTMLASYDSNDQFQPDTGNDNLARGLVSIFGNNLTQSAPERWKDLTRDSQMSLRAPYPIVGAAVICNRTIRCNSDRSSRDLASHTDSLVDSYFEMSPLRMGLASIGFREAHVGVAAGIAASSSAADMPGNDSCFTLTMLGLHGGLSGRFKPSPLHMDRSNEHALSNDPKLRRQLDAKIKPAKIRLIDGGYADNLASFPLVQRMCEHLVIVDAEHDPNLIFESYGYLKQQLRKDRIEFSIPGIDAITANTRAAGGAGNALVASRPECLANSTAARCVPAYQLTSPVFSGTIGRLPYADESSMDPRELQLKVTYIKLSLNQNDLTGYPLSVRTRFGEQSNQRVPGQPACVGRGRNETCAFPQESTYDLNFESGQFDAYWDLGRCIARRLFSNDLSAVCNDTPWPALRAGKP